ncbi:MAG: DUF4136 domain-containing protein [Pseudomonadota bacterium]|nr:DUF4136 domain-containing protein [Pseudomonadota bacterium]
MPRLPFPLLALTAGGVLASLAACTTTPVAGPVEVTRFHRLPAAPGTPRGALRLELVTSDASSLELAPYRAAIAAELTRAGYRVLPASAGEGTAQSVARLRVEQERFRPSSGRSPVSVGGSAGTGGYGSGVGLGIGLDLTPRPGEQIETRLFLTIDDAASGARQWEGRAHRIVSSKSDLAAPDASAQALARALLEGFPGESGETILVK